MSITPSPQGGMPPPGSRTEIIATTVSTRGFWSRVLISWLVSAVAIAITTWILPGLHIQGDPATKVLTVLVMAAILGFLNAILRPILYFLSCGCIVLTLGLFIFIVNAAVFWLASGLTPNYSVDSFWWALLASIIVSIITFIVNYFVYRNDTTTTVVRS
ncbi:MAG: phage holin family protein [Anaerolineae bacterium]